MVAEELAPASEPLSVPDLTHVAQWLLSARRAESARLVHIRRFFRGEITGIYVPESASEEYRDLVAQSRFNILPLVENSVAQHLMVDGYRPARQAENAAVWDEVWQPNRLDARQAGMFRPALRYGSAYARVLPGQLHDRPVPTVTPFSPRRMTCLYEDPINDQWPEYALAVGAPRPLVGSGQPEMVCAIAIYDAHHEYRVDVPASVVTPHSAGQYLDTGAFSNLALDASRVRVRNHGLGVCPVVRFLPSYGDIDDGPQGIIEPLLDAQKGLNQTTFGLKMAELYAAFRQRWATGMEIPQDEDGNPIEPWNAAVNRVWSNESPDGRFGDFAETDLTGYLNSRDKQLLYVASVRQIPPHTLVVGNAVSNVSAEALAALEAGHQQDIAETKIGMGESVEQLLRLCGLAMGDTATWEDTSAQVVWRDTTPRSLGQVVDAWGKAHQMLGVPQRALWDRLPGTTDQDIERWEALADEEDLFARMEAMLGQGEESSAAVGSDQAAGGSVPDPVVTGAIGGSATSEDSDSESEARSAQMAALTDGNSNAGENSGAAPSVSAEDVDVIKDRADALGALIRSGVEPEDAARRVGLEGARFVPGASPAALRLPTDGSAAPAPPADEPVNEGED